MRNKVLASETRFIDLLRRLCCRACCIQIKHCCKDYVCCCLAGDNAEDIRLDFNVSAPPQPGDIIWENLNITECERFGRRVLTGVLALLLIAGCFFAVWGVTVAKKSYLADRKEELEEQLAEQTA